MRNKLGQFIKGFKPWNKGKKRPEISGKNHYLYGKHLTKKTKDKISKTKKGIIPQWRKGKHHTEEAKEKMREARKKQVGANSPGWKGGISTYERKLYLNARRRAIKINAEGSHTQKEWEDLKKKYNYTCLACRIKEPKIKLTEDHIIPLSKDGSDYIENIQPLCRSCNSIKHYDIIDYRRSI